MSSTASVTSEIANIPVYERSGSDLAGLDSEWVLANGIGGFAMGTIPGVPTRRYHALLVGAERPPVERVAALNAIDESVVIDPGGAESIHHLTPFHFEDSDDRPESSPRLVSFRRDLGCTWTFSIPTPAGDATIRKRLWLYRDRNAAAITYSIDTPTPLRIVLRPLVSLRDFHALAQAPEDPKKRRRHRYGVRRTDDGLIVTNRAHGMLLAANEEWSIDETWWRRLRYQREIDRGLEHTEDLFCPAALVVDTDGTHDIRITASLDATMLDEAEADEERERSRMARLVSRTTESVCDNTTAEDDQRDTARLAAASDLFIVRRDEGSSVIAGYPWFSDWGRDTMIALPGLLLTAGRHDEAGNVLETFAAHQRNGIIPNRFDDYAGENHYNTADASLWFVHACCEYMRATNDRDRFNAVLRNACMNVVHAYRDGTDYDIGVDPEDGLVTAGNEETQLTWMDAKRDGVTFTPRHGKCIEINALWRHGLVALAHALDDSDAARDILRSLADQAGRSIIAKLWNAELGCCFDRLSPTATGWKPEPEIRPNQIFAASLEYSPLEPAQRASLLRVVRDHLLTPHGLRTLAPSEPGYQPCFEGPIFERDRAYHNGTAWAWLLGPYAEGVLRAGDFSDASRDEARRALEPLVRSLDGQYPGTLPEVYDAELTDGRQRPDGCIAQAWSVAETLRVHAMILSNRPS